MQTFITYPDFTKSARYLDNKRLGKQLVECSQIYDTIINNKKAWSNHPCVKMWRGYENGLLYYGLVHYTEWQIRLLENLRGGTLLHKSGEFIREEIRMKNGKEDFKLPAWIYDERVYLSHRGNLIRKDPEYYGKFWPNINPVNGYYWSV